MPTVRVRELPKPKQTRMRWPFVAALIGSVIVSGSAHYLLHSTNLLVYQAEEAMVLVPDGRPTSFPVGVDPIGKTITENPAVLSYFEESIPLRPDLARNNMSVRSLFSLVGQKLAGMSWYQNLATPSVRVLVIDSGERKEQIAKHFGDILGWNIDDKKRFLALVATSSPELSDGMYAAGSYVATRGATPEEVAPLISERFESEVLSRYGADVEEVVPLKDALTIASLLEREAYDFEDMRHISGVIWNRLFAGMNLQIDATLQYAKGSKPYEPWWPRVRPADKYIDSPYNTYKNKGLPPGPIANPSLDAILAALNPTKTECMYYFHDRNAGFHCSEDYAGHVELLKQYYGRGK